MPHPVERTDQIHVLLCDDDADSRSLTRLVLECDPRMRIVAEASSAEQAIQRFGWVLPDVILFDLMMPGMPADEAIALMRSHAMDCRVVLLSSYPASVLAEQAKKVGADGWVEKAASLREIRDAILAAIERPRPLAATG